MEYKGPSIRRHLMDSGNITTVKIIFFLNTRKLNLPNTEAGHLAFLCLKWLHFYLCLHLPLDFSTVREGAYYQIMQELICWDEVCFRIRSPNLIIYPARALVNTLSMVKCLIDKYWNKIILSCLRFLPALYPGGGKKLKTGNWCQTPSE